ncbi:MAG: OmpA family protein [Spirochaetota bacterium]
MKTIKFILGIIFLIIFISAPVFADLFYWPSEYKGVYDDKVAIELQYDSIKREYAGEKARLETKIRDFEAAIKSLNDQMMELRNRNENEQKNLSARIKELQAQNAILKSKGSTREKELLEENRKLNDRLSGEIKRLTVQLAKEQTDSRAELETLKAGFDKKSAEMLARINEQNDIIANLKKLSDTQKAELNRLAQQAGEIEKQLEDEIKNGQIRFKKMLDRIIINLDDKICFDTGSSKLKPEIKKALDKINNILVNFPENRIYIEGNTDNVPISNSNFRNNWQLSTERALSVLEYLLGNAKLNPKRVSAVGNGEYNPVLSNETPENRALNRRVDIIIIPSVSAK